MRPDKLINAINEARRFLVIAKLVVIKENELKRKYIEYGKKENAACKRASMDLTRALAELRKS
jgi:hypothetical protein